MIVLYALQYIYRSFHYGEFCVGGGALIAVGFLVGELEAVADTDEVGAGTDGACPVLHGVANHYRFRRKTAALLECFFDDESLGVGCFISTADGGNPLGEVEAFRQLVYLGLLLVGGNGQLHAPCFERVEEVEDAVVGLGKIDGTGTVMLPEGKGQLHAALFSDAHCFHEGVIEGRADEFEQLVVGRRLDIAGTEDMSQTGDDALRGIKDSAVKVKDGGGVLFHITSFTRCERLPFRGAVSEAD